MRSAAGASDAPPLSVHTQMQQRRAEAVPTLSSAWHATAGMTCPRMPRQAALSLCFCRGAPSRWGALPTPKPAPTRRALPPLPASAAQCARPRPVRPPLACPDPLSCVLHSAPSNVVAAAQRCTAGLQPSCTGTSMQKGDSIRTVREAVRWEWSVFSLTHTSATACACRRG